MARDRYCASLTLSGEQRFLTAGCPYKHLRCHRICLDRYSIHFRILCDGLRRRRLRKSFSNPPHRLQPRSPSACRHQGVINNTEIEEVDGLSTLTGLFNAINPLSASEMRNVLCMLSFAVLGFAQAAEVNQKPLLGSLESTATAPGYTEPAQGTKLHGRFLHVTGESVFFQI